MKIIPLTQRKFAIVNDEDYDYLSQWKWCAQRDHGSDRWYVVRSVKLNGKVRILSIHRAILGAKPGDVIDHINGDGLDNRRANLRFATNSQNVMNSRKSRCPKSSRFKGVSWSKRDRNWQARIKFFGKQRRLGSSLSEEEAAKTYDQAAQQIFREFARPNFSGD